MEVAISTRDRAQEANQPKEEEKARYNEKHYRINAAGTPYAMDEHTDEVSPTEGE